MPGLARPAPLTSLSLMRQKLGAGRVLSVLTALAVTSTLLGACGGGKKNAQNSASTTVPVSSTTSSSTSTTTTTPKPQKPTCPLLGTPPPNGKVPHRPALAVKVENLPQARPQWGLDHADIVMEEPVEGGITRFIAIFQCHNTTRIEPVRSGRLVDVDLLEPLGKTLFAYAGAIDPVLAKIAASPWMMPITAMTYGPPTFYRDDARYAPHNLVTSTQALYKVAAQLKYSSKPPHPLFTYGPLQAGAQAASAVHINFPLDVTSWTWDVSRQRWMRSYSDTGPGMLGDNTQINAVNVVILHVHEYPTQYVEDPTGAHENELTLTGSGPAWVLRNGVVFRCAWFRKSLADTTTFIGPHHERLTLAPGNTWEELVPFSSTVDVSP